ncbi:hypothetical protein BJ741DRAFT_592165 [Chytriomyces cf. hyalinus JEL632]|nr:hypothetical protein BJ741DRAFT_592165 [Chytriomyces cf. hyalinus JEL632]
MRSAAWHKRRYNKPIESRKHENAQSSILPRPNKLDVSVPGSRNADNDNDNDAVDPPAPSPFTWPVVKKHKSAKKALAAPAPAPTPTKGPASVKGPEPAQTQTQTPAPAPAPVPDSALCFTHFCLTLEDPSAWVEFNNSHYLETLKNQVTMNPSVGPGLYCEKIMNLKSLDGDECVRIVSSVEPIIPQRVRSTLSQVSKFKLCLEAYMRIMNLNYIQLTKGFALRCGKFNGDWTVDLYVDSLEKEAVLQFKYLVGTRNLIPTASVFKRDDEHSAMLACVNERLDEMESQLATRTHPISPITSVVDALRALMWKSIS